MQTDLSARQLFSTTTHLMLAAATRFAVGAVYEAEASPEQELILLAKLLLREFTRMA